MTDPTQIYIALIGENIDAWRPVKAKHLRGSVYRIISQPYDRTIETWQFELGDEVVCESVQTNEGPILAAKRLAQDRRS
jgi:hypothetical protein